MVKTESVIEQLSMIIKRLKSEGNKEIKKLKIEEGQSSTFELVFETNLK